MEFAPNDSPWYELAPAFLGAVGGLIGALGVFLAARAKKRRDDKKDVAKFNREFGEMTGQVAVAEAERRAAEASLRAAEAERAAAESIHRTIGRTAKLFQDHYGRLSDDAESRAAT